MWAKRTTVSVNCPSGQTAMVQRPGPGLGLKGGKFARIFESKEAKEARKSADQMLEYIEGLPDEELLVVMQFARALIVECVVDPPIVANPKGEQLGPDDIPLPDFWHIFSIVIAGVADAPIKTKDGETDIESVQTFPEQQGIGLVTVGDGETVQ